MSNSQTIREHVSTVAWYIAKKMLSLWEKMQDAARATISRAPIKQHLEKSPKRNSEQDMTYSKIAGC